MVARGGFEYRGDHVVCPQGKILKRAAYHRRDASYQYVARQKDCQACPIKETCLPPKQKRRYFTLTMYYPEFLRAKERNRTAAYRRERRRRQTIAEGTFASLDRLIGARSRLQGLWKVDCEGYMAALARNVLKLVRKLSHGVAPPGPVLSATATVPGASSPPVSVALESLEQSRRFFRQSWLAKNLQPTVLQTRRHRGRLSQRPRLWKSPR